MTAREHVPTTWTSADEDFFRVVARLFPADFLSGAGVLLAEEQEPADVPAPSPVVPQRPAADLPPVRVRRTP